MIVNVGYMITNGQSFVYDKNCKSIGTDYKSAYIWKDLESANNVLSVSETRKILPLVGFHVDVAKFLVTPINDETKSVIDKVTGFLDCYKSIKDTLSTLQKRLSEVDRKLSDVEHYIELTDQNAVNGYRLYKRIKDLRIERRNIKRLIELKNIFDKVSIDTSICDDITSKISGFESKIFSPRELNFNNILEDWKKDE